MESKAKRKYYCVVKGCASKEMSDTIKFHRSPVDKTINAKWCIALKVKKIPIFSVVCSKKILPQDYLPDVDVAKKWKYSIRDGFCTCSRKLAENKKLSPKQQDLFKRCQFLLPYIKHKNVQKVFVPPKGYNHLLLSNSQLAKILEEPSEEAPANVDNTVDIDKYIEEMPSIEQLRKVLNAVDNSEDTKKVENDEDVICIDSVKGNSKDSDEDQWPVEALDEYIEILLNKEEPITHPPNHLVKKEQIPEAHNYINNRMQEIQKKEIEAQQNFNKKIHAEPIERNIDKKEILPIKKIKKESVEKQRTNFDFPKKPTSEKDTAESSIEQIIQSISGKFHDLKKKESLRAKASIICTHLLAVKEQYRNKCLLQISIHLDQYKK